ncbi:hypothetical protein BGZ97_008248 [Linnemannia gamsii]|uniref:Uncharacterized protein n=1 Tax=Linnemannia gamsii TaxID=64522 RepID=A0A9P6QPD7_9FUNG|nr:hypothetical protein BGZ97_008248 [Linnemannia gamsii]
MAFKISTLLALATATLLVAVSSHETQVAADTFPQWCICGNNQLTGIVCNKNRGNWDGGSCGLDNQRAFDGFVQVCKNYKQELKCWH